ncbi:MAG: thiamine phosphate synthase [bacterium]
MEFNIYLIGDKNFFKDEDSYLEALDECFYNGIKAFQLRQKDISVSEFIKLGEKIKLILKKYRDVKFFVNDRVDAALALEAFGVHLNINSIPVKAVKKKIKNLKIFYSSHSLEEAIEAEKNGADFITFSPIYKTKNREFQQGTEMLKRAVESVKIPVFALGGITENNLAEIKKAGGKYIAVQSAILKAADIGKTVRTLMNIMGQKII